MHNHADESLLRAAPPSKCNKQQPPQNGTTGNATATQQTPAKPPSLLDLARNKLRNNHATVTENGTQQAPKKSLLHVASASECNTQQPHTVASWHWWVQFPERDPLEVYCNPDATHAEILERYPDALAAEPIPERTMRTATETDDASCLPLTAAEDERRTCEQCLNLDRRRCLAAWRGEIVANRDYEPDRDIPRRCEGYVPGADDPDKRTGGERWPKLIEKKNSHAND